ncbi:MAG: DUF3108 domain-containing protein [Bradymonadaceae bacterium]
MAVTMYPRHLLSILGLVLGLFIALPTTAAERSERLQYSVHYGPATLASLNVQVGCTARSYRPAMLTAQSQGFADQVRSFTVRLDSFIEARSGYSLEGRTFIEEKGLPRRYRSRFSANPSVRVEREFRGKTRHEDIKLPQRGHDLLSWLLDLRNEPTLATNTRHSYFVWDGWKLVQLDAIIGKPEKIQSPQGTYTAYPITLERTRLPHDAGEVARGVRHKKERVGTLWLTTDARRLPIAMTFRAPIGEVRITLTGAHSSPCGS